MDCTYTFDPTTREAESSLETAWECPHEAVPDAEYCPFHLPPSDYDAHGLDADAVADALRRTVADAAAPKEFVGATFHTLDLAYDTLEAHERRPIDLRHASIASGFDLSMAAVEHPLDVRGAEFGAIDWTEARFDERVRANDLTVTGETTLTGATFRDDVDADHATFAGDVTAAEARFEGDTSLRDAVFDGDATFVGVEFQGDAHVIADDVCFADAAFRGHADFTEARFRYADFTDVTFAAPVTFDGAVFDGDAQFPAVEFADGATFTEARFRDDADLSDVRFRAAATFDGAEFQGGANTRDDDLTAVGTVFEDDASFAHVEFRYADFSETRFDGDADFTETTYGDDARFSNATFGDDVRFDEARFHDDAAFDHLSVDGEAFFRGVEFHGGANLLDEDVTFADATFAADAAFDRAEFGYVDGRDVAFEGDAVFVETTFTDRAHFERITVTGDCDFDQARFADRTGFDYAEFQGSTRFDEAEFDSNVSFANAAFADRATFRGTALLGSTTVLEDDADFRNTRFDAGADFEKAEFRYANFSNAVFEGDVSFDNSFYEIGGRFADAVFEGALSFTDAAFEGDVSFDRTRFADVTFTETEFTGDSNIHGRGATFTDAVFEGDAEFDRAEFRSANFVDTVFGGDVDFRDTRFYETCEFELRPADDHVLVDARGADLAGGRITQPADGDAFYDLTNATIADVELVANDSDYELFDYVRFCDTDFDGFDFSAHLDELSRNNWVIHRFALESDDTTSRSFEPIENPSLLESTYLKAKNSADAFGQRKAAAEFFIKELSFRRKKNWRLLRNSTEDVRVRSRAGGKWLGNALLYHSCGYGERLWRVGYISAAVVLLWGALFTLLTRGTQGATDLPNAEINSLAELFSPAGVVVFGRNVYFSAVTFTTLGYGDIQPVGAAARMLASVEAFLGSLLVALVVFVLGRRVTW